MSDSTTALPIVYGRLGKRYREHRHTRRLIIDQCPHCGGEHWHGWCDDLPADRTEHRVSHCDGGGYLVKLMEDVSE